MTEKIGLKLTEICSEIVSFSLSEAETESYPFAVYDYTPTAIMTKDGVYKYKASVQINVVSPSFDEALEIVNDIDEALKEIGDGFTYTLSSTTSDCTEGIWTITMEIIVNQYR